MNISPQQIIHHGLEALGFIAAGTVVLSSFPTACAACCAGKVTYLATKTLLEAYGPESLSLRRFMSWVPSLLASGYTIQSVLRNVEGRLIDNPTTVTALLVVTAVGLAFRAVCEEAFKALNA